MLDSLSSTDGVVTTVGHERVRIAAPLGHRVREGVDGAGVADAIAATWLDVDVALRPVIGQRGVVALFNRSVHLTAATHPWLAAARQDPLAELDAAALKALFTQHDVAQSLTGGNTLLLTFHQLLATLIGSSLTERLLRHAWGSASGDAPAEAST